MFCTYIPSVLLLTLRLTLCHLPQLVPSHASSSPPTPCQHPHPHPRMHMGPASCPIHLLFPLLLPFRNSVFLFRFSRSRLPLPAFSPSFSIAPLGLSIANPGLLLVSPRPLAVLHPPTHRLCFRRSSVRTRASHLTPICIVVDSWI